MDAEMIEQGGNRTEKEVVMLIAGQRSQRPEISYIFIRVNEVRCISHRINIFLKVKLLSISQPNLMQMKWECSSLLSVCWLAVHGNTKGRGDCVLPYGSSSWRILPWLWRLVFLWREAVKTGWKTLKRFIWTKDKPTDREKESGETLSELWMKAGKGKAYR